MPTLFRPCIDIHDGKVKQIIGSSFQDKAAGLKTNFVANRGADYYAGRYRHDSLWGGHVIQIGPGNGAAARTSLAAWPTGLQLGGGVNAENALQWIQDGARKVIVTSYLFPDGHFSEERLKEMVSVVTPGRLVIDLSCRRKDDSWFVATNKWQTMTDFEVSKENLDHLSQYCSEFLVHAVDKEGMCNGIDEDLVKVLGEWSTINCTYAGGAQDISDLELVDKLSNGKVDLAIGSALDIFGGDKVKYEECVAWNRSKGY